MFVPFYSITKFLLLRTSNGIGVYILHDPKLEDSGMGVGVEVANFPLKSDSWNGALYNFHRLHVPYTQNAPLVHRSALGLIQTTLWLWLTSWNI